jgi:hypothetical protein
MAQRRKGAWKAGRRKGAKAFCTCAYDEIEKDARPGPGSAGSAALAIELEHRRSVAAAELARI